MLIPVSLFLFTLMIYLRTACATFNANDSGETIMVCDLLAIGHSPSYPLHALCGRLFCLLPMGQPMWRVTFSSTIIGSASVTMVYFFLKKLFKNIPWSTEQAPGATHKPAFWALEISSLSGALLFAFSNQFWFQAGGAKGGIYALNIFISICLLYFCLKMREDGWFSKSIILMGFFFGLGLTDHWPNQVAMAPAYLWFFFTNQKRVPLKTILGSILRPFDQWKNISDILSSVGPVNLIRTFAFGFLSLSVYLYLPLRSVQNPAVNWWNPQTFQRLRGTIFRESYNNTGQTANGDPRGWTTFVRNIEQFGTKFQDQFGPIFTFLVLALAIYGLVWLFRKNQKSSAIGICLFGISVLFSTVLFPNPSEDLKWTLDNFFVPVFLATALLAGAGILGLFKWISNKWSLAFIPVTLRFLTAGFLLAPLFLNFKKMDQSRYTAAYDFGMNILKTANNDSVIICNADPDLFAFWYLQYVSNKRPQIAHFAVQLLPFNWYTGPLFKKYPFLEVSIKLGEIKETTALDIIGHTKNERAVYSTHLFDSNWLVDSFPSLPEGLLWRVLESKDLNYPLTSMNLNKLYGTYRIRNITSPRIGYWDDFSEIVRGSYGIAYEFLSSYALQRQMFEIALWSANLSLKYSHPKNYPDLYQTKGDAFLALGNPNEALQNYQGSLKWTANNAYINAKMGDAYLMLKDRTNAEAAFKVSLSFNPNQKEALEGLQKLNKN